ncbi:YjdF family protein [Priestia megaterium]|uniref:YjdF family protein n=1 Tax=Priestia megaterium TaxID=1404 RepID=UPI001EDAA1B7|nr:YjdF family protein [Priestia megaterium]MDH3161447.1 YjdF family protein [Priestia megaterium]MED4116962.1 YjdF family protein [Priestia megaterium]UKJ83450.1 YjdF family protein [Priestia megaterium]
MSLTIYHDGQFWVGIIEVVEGGKLKAFRYVFGAEPKDKEILDFIYYRLLDIINQSVHSGLDVRRKSDKKINPKRLQRQVAKERNKVGVSTKAEEAIKQEYEEKKKSKKKRAKQYREELKEQKYLMKKQKAKAKHKGK